LRHSDFLAAWNQGERESYSSAIRAGRHGLPGSLSGSSRPRRTQANQRRRKFLRKAPGLRRLNFDFRPSTFANAPSKIKKRVGRTPTRQPINRTLSSGGFVVSYVYRACLSPFFKISAGFCVHVLVRRCVQTSYRSRPQAWRTTTLGVCRSQLLTTKENPAGRGYRARSLVLGAACRALELPFAVPLEQDCDEP
jgi:hypothetical protein